MASVSIRVSLNRVLVQSRGDFCVSSFLPITLPTYNFYLSTTNRQVDPTDPCSCMSCFVYKKVLYTACTEAGSQGQPW